MANREAAQIPMMAAVDNFFLSSARESNKGEFFHVIRNFQRPMEQNFSGIQGKEDNLLGYTEIFVNFLPGITVPFDFPPGISA